MSLPETDADKFRDTISIVNKKGGRKWVYPKKPNGRYTTARTLLSFFLLAALFGLPFIKIDGHPFMLLNVFERKFIIFGTVFVPQDFYLFGLLMISLFVTLFLVTAVFGRIFCGWFCPQTVFLEMVFFFWSRGNHCNCIFFYGFFGLSFFSFNSRQIVYKKQKVQYYKSKLHLCKF